MSTWVFPIHRWLDFSNSILPVLLVLLVVMIVRKIKPGKPTGISILFGLAFSTCMVFGAQLDDQGSVPFANVGMWISILLLSCVMTMMVSGLWNAMDQKTLLPCTKKKEETRQETYWFIIRTAVLLFALYFVVFLAVYPGFFVYDAQEEYLEIVTRNFSTHHPLLHVLLMGGLVHLFYKISGSYNIGIAAYTLVQMAILSGVFGYFVWKMKKRGLPGLGQLLLTLYLGFCPVLVMFTLCSAKDGLFVGMLLVQVLLLGDLCLDTEKFIKNKIKIIFLILSSLGMMLMRNNGCYAFAVFLPLLAVFFAKTKGKRFGGRILLFGVLLIAGYLLTAKGLAVLTKAEDSGHKEILTVPIMQMARTYTYDKEDLTDEQVETLCRYLPEEALLRYRPKLSDPVKCDFNNEAYEQDKESFWRVWAQIGRKHPFSYINAWLMTSYGFWYPDTVIDVYRGNTVFTYTYEDSSYFGYEVEAPGTRESKLPFLDELYRNMSLTIFQQKIPLLSMLFSPGFLFWCMMFGIGFLLNRKEKSMERILPFLLPVLIFLTFLLGPTYLVRYVVFWWVFVPLLAIEICAILTGGYEENR